MNRTGFCRNVLNVRFPQRWPSWMCRTLFFTSFR